MSVSALSGLVFCYLLIILFYLHLPNKIIFPHGVLISFSSLHHAKQGLKITPQDFFFFLTCSVHWKLPNCYLFLLILPLRATGKKETHSAVLQDNSDAVTKGKFSLSPGLCLWCSGPVGLIFSYTNNLKTNKISESVEMPTPDILHSPQRPSLRGLTEHVLAWGTCNTVRQGGGVAKMHHHNEM